MHRDPNWKGLWQLNHGSFLPSWPSLIETSSMSTFPRFAWLASSSEDSKPLKMSPLIKTGKEHIPRVEHLYMLKELITHSTVILASVGDNERGRDKVGQYIIQVVLICWGWDMKSKGEINGRILASARYGLGICKKQVGNLVQWFNHKQLFVHYIWITKVISKVEAYN